MICPRCAGSGRIGKLPCLQCMSHGEVDADGPRMNLEMPSCMQLEDAVLHGYCWEHSLSVSLCGCVTQEGECPTKTA